MGNNFYVRTPPSCGGKCETHCHGEDIHLGKSSAGWSFTFRAYPHPEDAPEVVTWSVTDFASWRKLLDLGPVYSEYGEPITRDDLLERIEVKRKPGYRHHEEGYGAFRDADGNDFIATEFS